MESFILPRAVGETASTTACFPKVCFELLLPPRRCVDAHSNLAPVDRFLSICVQPRISENLTTTWITLQVNLKDLRLLGRINFPISLCLDCLGKRRSSSCGSISSRSEKC